MRSSFVQQAPPSKIVTGLLTTAQPFTRTLPIVAAGVNPAVLQPSILAIPGTNRWEQRKMGVRLSGFHKIGADGNATVGVYAGTDPVAANNTLLGSTGAIALTSAGVGAPWWVDLDLIFDSIAGKLCGRIQSQVGQTLVAAAAISNQITGLNGATEPVFNICAFVTFSVANAGTYSNLMDFGLEG